MDPPKLRGELLGGKYRLGDVIGAGGMGVVYEATHTELRTPCAVKVVAPERGDPTQFKRLVREARVLAQLSGPYAVRVLDAGRLPEGSPYLVMERLTGEPLSELLERSGRLPSEQAILFACQVCAAVGEAHERGIIHRDIKPSNVFVVAPDRVKVLDFGLATRFGSLREDSVATESEFAGSPRYMSPEQIRSSAEVTPRSDLWSIGVVLFEMLTGRLPFHGPNTGALLAAIVADPAARLRSLVPEAPPELDRLIADCLEKNPGDRPRDAAEVHARLSALRGTARVPLLLSPAAGDAAPDDGQSTVADVSPALPVRGRARRSARAFALTMTLLAMTAAAVALWGASKDTAPKAAEQPAPGSTTVVGPSQADLARSEAAAPPPDLAAATNPVEPATAEGSRRAGEPPRRPRVVQAPSHAGTGAVLDAISTRH